MKHMTIAGAVATAVIFSVNAAAAGLKPGSEADKLSYSIGYQLGDDFNKQGVDLNVEAVSKGIEDALSGSKTLLSAEEMATARAAMRKKMAAIQKQRKDSAVRGNLEKAKTFLKENAHKEGVQSTQSGLQYKIVKAGSGDSPQASDKVAVQYRGTLPDGSEFDSSYKRGAMTFRVDQVIAGWTEALTMMKPGAKWRLFIPPELGYGEAGSGTGSIPPNSVLIFDVELVSVKDQGKDV